MIKVTFAKLADFIKDKSFHDKKEETSGANFKASTEMNVV
jgi:hypothetical protein